jgi:hypothetical protein
VVTVSSVLPEGDDPEAAPIRDPLGVEGFPWEWVVPLAVPMLLAAGLLAMWSRRWRRGDVAAARTEVSPLAELEALLDRLEARVGHEPNEGLCDQLAFGLRRYLQRQSDRPAEDMTSFELRGLIREMEWPDDAQRGVPTVTATVDRVRFGREPVDELELRRAVTTTRDLARSIDEHLLAQAAFADAETAA